MTDSLKNKIQLLAFVICALFVVAGIKMSHYSSVWGDEEFHTNTAIAKNIYGDLFYRDIIHNNGGTVTDIEYTRGLLITNVTAYLFKTFGDNVFYPRLFVFLISILTCFLVIIYLKYFLHSEKSELLLAVILILAHPFYFESSYYLRFYTIYNFFIFFAAACFWEAFKAFKVNRKFLYLWLGLGLIFSFIPSLDDWQKTHWPFFLLLLCICGVSKSDRLISFFVKYRKCFLFLLLILFLFAPHITFIFDKVLIKIGLKMGSRAYLGYHHYYWDNLLGTFRFLLSLNVILWVVWKNIKLTKEMTFQELITYGGIIFGLLLGLLVPHNHIFYTRFFLLSTFFVTAGAGYLILKFHRRDTLKLISIYISINLLLTVMSFNIERPNVWKSVEWLKLNYQPKHQILISDFDYVWTSKSKFANSFFTGGDWGQTKVASVIERVEKCHCDTVFFFFYNSYDFREKIHRSMFGDERIPTNTISRYLIRKSHGEKVVWSRGAGVLKFTRDSFIKEMKNYQESDFVQRKSIIQRTKDLLRFL